MIPQAHQELHKGIDLPHVNGTRRIEKNDDAFNDDADAKAAIQGENFYLGELKTVAVWKREPNYQLS